MFQRMIRLAGVALVTTALVAPAAMAADYAVDASHASVVFKVDHLGTPFYGFFRTVAGKVTWDKANPTASKISLSIESKSIYTNNKKRDDHLKGPDFFDVGQYPTISFESTSVKVTGATLQVTGNLTLHGKTKAVTATVKNTFDAMHPMVKKPAVGFDAQLSFKRSDFGMNYMVGKGLGDEVTVMIGLEAISQ